MSDLHIEAMIRQYTSDNQLNDCELVREYRQSGCTVTDPIEEVTCSDEKTREIQAMFQTCSHSTATSVYQTIQDITSVKIISHKLCQALTTIGTVCIKHLYQCFAEEDVKQMRKSHLEEMKTFLLRISEDKVAENVFENCVVMEYVERDEQKLSNIAVDEAVKSEEKEEGEDNKIEVKNNPENIVDIETTTEELITEQIKGARSVETTSTASTISVTALVRTDQKETTEWNEKIEHTSDVVDEIPGDKGDELGTKKDDKVVDEKVEESAVIPPEEHTSGGGRQSITTIVSITTLILIIDKLW